MILHDLLSGLREPPCALDGDANVQVSSIASDSRSVQPGALFFALPGTRTDGRRFATHARDRGAVAIAARELVEGVSGVVRVAFSSIQTALSEVAARFYGYPSRRLRLVGVTGTNGKTTITHLLESIWTCAGFRPGIIGTIHYRVGERTWPAPFTTPQAADLQRLLAEMLDSGATHVAMEVSSHALALDRARDCEWDGAIFTNLTRDHLDFHPDMESYFAAKQRLFAELLPASPKSERFAVVNRDDPYGRRIAATIRDRLVTFGRGEDADVAPIEVERSLSGLRGEMRIGGDRLRFSSRLVGDAHLENLLAAAGAAWAQGIPFATIAEGIRTCPGIPGRMEQVAEGAPFAVLVDYAHSPDALERALRGLRSLTRRRLITVFGCGGDRDRGKRPLMGEAAARLADVVILTSDNPRTEDPQRILSDIEGGVSDAGLAPLEETAAKREEAKGYLVIPERRLAIRSAVDIAGPGDVVLIAGKGHESVQILGNDKIPFDDREEARKCLRESTP